MKLSIFQFEITYFVTRNHVDGALDQSGERLQKDAVSVSEFTGLVWTEYRFV